MTVTCPNCKLEIKDDKEGRCPRCYTILKVYKKCEDCKGCSLFRACKKD